MLTDLLVGSRQTCSCQLAATYNVYILCLGKSASYFSTMISHLSVNSYNVYTMENRNNTPPHRYELCHFILTMSPVYLVKLEIAQKQPTAYCSEFSWTNRSKHFRKCFNVPLFPSLLQNSFSSLPAENLLHSHGFYQKFIIKVNMVNFNM